MFLYYNNYCFTYKTIQLFSIEQANLCVPNEGPPHQSIGGVMGSNAPTSLPTTAGEETGSNKSKQTHIRPFYAESFILKNSKTMMKWSY